MMPASGRGNSFAEVILGSGVILTWLSVAVMFIKHNYLIITVYSLVVNMA